MKHYYKDLIIIGVWFLALLNIVQSDYLLDQLNSSIKVKAYFLIHLTFISISLVFMVNSFRKKDRLLNVIINKFKSIPIPGNLKIIIVIVFTGNILAIVLGKPRYPFYDVGMFRWHTNFTGADKIIYRPKYYYSKNGQYKILDLRKEGSFFLAEHFGWGYTHEFTFAATFHNRGQKENFDFLINKMKIHGVDTLWVGIHSINYETNEVKFDPDICNAININKTNKLYYGPIYIPEYQLDQCHEN